MDIKYHEITKAKGTEDFVLVNKKKYAIRFTPKHAEHIWDNYPDVLHNIKHREILTMLVKKAIIVEKNTNPLVCLAKFKNKVYETYVNIAEDRMEVMTSFRSNKQNYIDLYKKYEQN
ncbi:MAG: hypothetical protein ACK40G_13845 [Cytophagaceae bacterium]